MYLIKGNNINEIQIELFNLLKKDGEFVDVRGFKTLEIFPVVIRLTDIHNRCTTLLKRNWNLVFAIGELSWHMNGSNNLSDISYYSKNWNAISDDRMHISDSCYGTKIFKQSKNWDNVIKELKNDINSRRAVINLYSSDNTLGEIVKDVACTISIQFIVRKGKLDQIVTMRSNDVFWGLPNDIFFFTMIQEYLANLIEVDVGEYYHQVASMHIYKWHFDRLEEIISNPTYLNFSMPRMVDVDKIENFLKAEEGIRQNFPLIEKVNSEYWHDFVDILKLRAPYTSDKEKQKIINNSPYKELLKLCPASYIINS